MTRFILVRHGHVDGIQPERFRGREDIPLSELGRRQAAVTAAAINRRWLSACVYTSPMQRCQQTAQAIAAPADRSMVVLEGMNDLDYGRWQWKTFAEAREEAPGLFERWFAQPQSVRFPGGESLRDLVTRTTEAFWSVTAAHPRETVIIVAHDSVNRAVLMQALDQPLSAYWRLEQSPCGISELEAGPDGVRVLRANETAHLEALAAAAPPPLKPGLIPRAWRSSRSAGRPGA